MFSYDHNSSPNNDIEGDSNPNDKYVLSERAL